jgi:hypothetical protein
MHGGRLLKVAQHSMCQCTSTTLLVDGADTCLDLVARAGKALNHVSTNGATGARNKDSAIHRKKESFYATALFIGNINLPHLYERLMRLRQTVGNNKEGE